MQLVSRLFSHSCVCHTRNADEPPKTPPKEVLRRSTVSTEKKRSLHYLYLFFSKYGSARLKCIHAPSYSFQETKISRCTRCEERLECNQYINKLFYVYIGWTFQKNIFFKISNRKYREICKKLFCISLLYNF